MEDFTDHTIEVLYPGKQIAGDYCLQARLGRSDLADVWLADKEGKTWVVKTYLLPQAVSPEDWGQWQKSLRQLQQLVSPLVQIPRDFGLIQGRPYVVLPYCHYGAARQWVGKLSESELATFMFQGAKALHLLHQQDPPLLHLNLHLNNFLIDEDLNYVLGDIGLSGALRRGDNDPGPHAAYQAPETFANTRYGRPADIFSFGVCLYHMATGQLPFGKEGGDRLIRGARIPTLPDHFSARINQIIQVCLARVPEGRPDAGTLLRLAECYLQEANWRSVPGFSFATGRSVKKQGLWQRWRNKALVKPASPASQSLLPGAKWLIPASVALGIGITLYFINPLLRNDSPLGGQEAETIGDSGPIFAPTPQAEPIARSLEPTETTVAPQPKQPAISRPEPRVEQNVPRPVENVKTTPKPAQTPSPTPATTPQSAAPGNMKALDQLLQMTETLETQISGMAFAKANLSSEDQAYLQQLNSELSLLSKQVQNRVLFSASGQAIGWKNEGNNESWLKQMQASLRQHSRNLASISQRLGQ